MNYKNIRNNARGLYRQNFKLYILVALVMGAWYALSYIFGTLTFPGAWILIIRFLVTVLVYPLTVGNLMFFYNEYTGGRGKFSDLFRFYRSKAGFLAALKLGVVMTAISYINTCSIYLSAVLIRLFGVKYPSPVFTVLNTVPGVLIGIVYFVFFLRTYLVPFIFGANPQMKPFSAIKTSFGKTKGYVLDYIIFTLSFLWPLLLMIFVLAVTVSFLIAGTGIGGAMLFYFAILPFLAFFWPYAELCIAGFASEVINNGGDL